jgi:PAS domain S-box-containing protein
MKNEPGGAELFAGDDGILSIQGQVDWAGTPLGPVNGWAPELRSAAGICLHSQFQMAITWGDEFVYLYNDAASILFGDKHPWALGRGVAEVWPEAWPTIGPMLQAVRASGKPTRSDDLMLVLERNGRFDECYLTFSYSPIFVADGSVGGIFVTFMETTRRVVSERRQCSLADLATQVALRARDDTLLACVKAALERNPRDLPLAALVVEQDGHRELAFCTGFEASLPPAMAAVLDECAVQCLDSAETVVFDGTVLAGVVPIGPSSAPRQIFALPFWRGGEAKPGGAILLGASAYCMMDAGYRGFFDSIAGHVAHAVAIAEAKAAEEKHIAAKAELERSRLQFFASVSHELRTPLTLILGPLEMMLEQYAATLPAAQLSPLEMAYRNTQRLHKLVSSMMDFAIIENGSMPLVLEPVEPFAVTAEIVSLFRSAIEAAGLVLEVRSAGYFTEVMLDREMWETIVANLVSNALKYTEAGRIRVLLARRDDCLVLSVADTGIGIAPEESARIFERFYRSPSPTARRAHGSGVGLALVQELVRLHGGEVRVESELGAGSRFTVTVPWREAASAAPGCRDASPIGRVQSRFAAEVERYRAGESERSHPDPAPPGDRMRVVVIDDDSDVVRYVERLLAGTCSVVGAHDAESGLAAIRSTRPELVLVDVMIPGVDGLALVRRIRAEPPIHTVPLVVLSARAGEEARLEALDAGADDYLTKPFSARELIARVRSHVQMARVRRAAIEQEGELRRQIDAVKGDLASVLEGASECFVSLDHNLCIRSINGAALAVLRRDRAAVVGKPLARVARGFPGSDLERALRVVAAKGRDGIGEYFAPGVQRWYNVRCYPSPQGVLMFANDITAQKQAEQGLREAQVELERRVALRTAELSAANQLLTAVFDRTPRGVAVTGTDERVVRVNRAYALLAGVPEEALQQRSLDEWIEPADMERLRSGHRALLAGTCDTFEAEVRYRLPEGRQRWVAHFVSVIGPAWHDEQCFVTIAWDITERRHAETERQASARMLRTLYEQLQTVRQAERTALAREVHDQLGQVLSAAKIDIKLLEDDLRAGNGRMSTNDIIRELHSACNTLERAIVLVRHIATELRAPEVDAQGLYAALAWHARDFERRTRIACHLDFDSGRAHPSREAAVALLRIFQEAVTNVLRHAQATQVWVSLETRGAALLMRVRDDGIGIGPQRRQRVGGLGLRGMRERAELEGGTLRVARLCPGGTLVSVRMPLQDSKGPA